jgi:hypothetical protein
MNTTTLATVSISLAVAGSASAAVVVRSAAGADPASIQGIVDQFRADLGGVNNGVGGSFAGGRREINWDAAGADPFQSPALMPDNFFNRIPPPAGSPRGALFSTAGTGFLLSQRVSDGTGQNLRFGDINPSYDEQFQAFSETRLFAVQGSLVFDTHFFIPGSPSSPATTSGFGAVFVDVDLDGVTKVELFDSTDSLLHSGFVHAAASGLSFFGASFNAGEQVARVRITAGNALLGLNDAFLDDGFQDVVVMDDFIYGEPVPAPGAAGLALVGGTLVLRRRR